MPSRLLVPLTALALLLQPAAVRAQAACPSSSGGPLPVEATPQYMADPGWQKQVAFLDAGMAAMDLGRVRLLFVGDSIVANWQKTLFAQFYGTRAPLNLGLAGDSTQGVLWRLDHGPLGKTLRPDLVVLLIGTNDLWPGTDPMHVSLGIAEIVRLIERKSPGSHILLLGLLPRGVQPNDPLRLIVGRVNALISQCADPRVTYAQPGDLLMDGAGLVSNEIEYDYLHPTWLGYAILSGALEQTISQAMGPR